MCPILHMDLQEADWPTGFNVLFDLVPELETIASPFNYLIKCVM